MTDAGGNTPSTKDALFLADVRLVATWARKNSINHLVKESADRLLSGGGSRHACDNCGSREDVVFIPDPECGGVHAWHACAVCRKPDHPGRSTEGER